MVQGKECCLVESVTEMVLQGEIRDAACLGFKGKICESRGKSFQSQVYQWLTFCKMLNFSKPQFSFLQMDDSFSDQINV